MLQEQIKSLIAYFSAKGETLTPEAAEGDIRSWESGHGELVAELMNGNEVWYPVMESYAKATGLSEMPEDWKKPFVVPFTETSQTQE